MEAITAGPLLKLCHRAAASDANMVDVSGEGATSARVVLHTATTVVVAFSSMAVVGVSIAGLLRLKIPMMSYCAGSAKSRTGGDIAV